MDNNIHSLLDQIKSNYPNELLEDPLLNEITNALNNFHIKLMDNTNEKIFNLMMENWKSWGINYFYHFPSLLMAIFQYKNHQIIPSNGLFQDKDGFLWSIINDNKFYNINIQTDYDDQRGLFITLESDKLIDYNILKEIIFYGKGNFDDWFNEVINKECFIIINDIVIDEGKIIRNQDDLFWKSMDTPHYPMEQLLCHLYSPDLSYRFKILTNKEFYHKKIIIHIPYTKKGSWDLTLFINHGFLMNHRREESLPITIGEGPIYHPRTLESKEFFIKIDAINYKNKIIKIEEGYNLEANYNFKNIIVKNQLEIELFGEMALDINNKFIGQGIVSHGNIAHERPIIYLNNDGNFINIMVEKISHRCKNFTTNLGFNNIINNYIKIYYEKPHEKSIEFIWKSIKNMAPILGEVNNKNLFSVEILESSWTIGNKIIFFNKRNQIIDFYHWKCRINNGNYHRLMESYFQGIIEIYGPNYSVEFYF